MNICSLCGNEIAKYIQTCPFCGNPQRGTSGQRKKVTSGIANLNIKNNLPTVDEAISRFEREFLSHKHAGVAVVRVVHGWGSSGTGGKIKAAFHKLLKSKLAHNDIHSFLPGDHYSDKTSKGKELLETCPSLRSSLRTDRNNPGITFIIL